MRRPEKESLTGSAEYLENMNEQSKDYYAELDTTNLVLTEQVRAFVDELPWELREIFHLRYGERMSIRKISAFLGYKSPWPIQVRLEQISVHVARRMHEVGESVI